MAAGGPSWGMPVPVYVQYKPGRKPLKTWRLAQLRVWEKWHAAHLASKGENIPLRNNRHSPK